VPLPLPFDPFVTVIQDAFEAAIHPQPFPAFTETLPVPAFESTDRFDEPIEYVHGTGAEPDCVTVIDWLATVTIPCRVDVDPFEATENCTCPGPVPL
jgi:hypothetical protein